MRYLVEYSFDRWCWFCLQSASAITFTGSLNPCDFSCDRHPFNAYIFHDAKTARFFQIGDSLHKLHRTYDEVGICSSSLSYFTSCKLHASRNTLCKLTFKVRIGRLLTHILTNNKILLRTKKIEKIPPHIGQYPARCIHSPEKKNKWNNKSYIFAHAASNTHPSLPLTVHFNIDSIGFSAFSIWRINFFRGQKMNFVSGDLHAKFKCLLCVLFMQAN